MKRKILWTGLSVLLLFFCIVSGLGASSKAGLAYLILLSVLAVLNTLTLFYPTLRFHSLSIIIQRAGLVIFTITFVMLAFLYAASFVVTTEPTGDEKAVIVLGAALKKDDQISPLLQKRLEVALLEQDYNTQLIVIVTGGQTGQHAISEARAMHEKLQEAGVDPDRIFEESKSLTTRENFEKTLELINGSALSKDDHFSIVTNRFHCYRVKHYATESGFSNINIIAAPTGFTDAVIWYLREVLATFDYWANTPFVAGKPQPSEVLVSQ